MTTKARLEFTSRRLNSSRGWYFSPVFLWNWSNGEAHGSPGSSHLSCFHQLAFRGWPPNPHLVGLADSSSLSAATRAPRRWCRYEVKLAALRLESEEKDLGAMAWVLKMDDASIESGLVHDFDASLSGIGQELGAGAYSMRLAHMQMAHQISNTLAWTVLHLWWPASRLTVLPSLFIHKA